MSDWYYNKNGHFYRNGINSNSSGASEKPEALPKIELVSSVAYAEIGVPTNITLKTEVLSGSESIVKSTIDGTNGLQKTVVLKPTKELVYTYTASVIDSSDRTIEATVEVESVYPMYWGSISTEMQPDGSPTEIDWNSDDAIDQILTSNKYVGDYTESVTTNFKASAPDYDHHWVAFIAYPATGKAANKKATFIDSLLNLEQFWSDNETTTINGMTYKVARTDYTAGDDGMIFTNIKLQ